MPSPAYFTASAPFWDFIERLESSTDEPGNPCGSRRRHHGRGCRRGPPNNQPGDGQPEGSGSGEDQPREPGEHGPHHRGPHGRGGRGGHCHGPRGGHRGGPPGGPHHHPFGPGFPGAHGGPWGHPHHHRGGAGGFPFGGAFNPFGHRGGSWPFSWAGNNETPGQEGMQGREFKPAVDLFTSPEAYTLHFSLPGAKREDIGVIYDPAKSELAVSGVIHRLGDEEFLKTLSSSFRERDNETGVFERKIRFGNRRWNADVNENAIAAKLEDGVLIVVLPRNQKTGDEEKKRSVTVETEDDQEQAEVEKAEKEAYQEVQQSGLLEKELESETERGDIDGDTLYSKDEKKNVTFDEDEHMAVEDEEESDEDFVDVKRVDVQ